MKKTFSKPVKQIDFVPFCPLHEQERRKRRVVDAQSRTAKLVALAVGIATAAVILLIGGAS